MKKNYLYQILTKTMLISKVFMAKKTLFLIAILFSSNLIFSQNTTITGKIVDEYNEELPGVNVVIKGTTNGIITDIEGKFELSIKKESSTIVLISSIGFISQEVLLGDKNVINIILIEDIIGLDEIVVVGYGTQKKATLTGATTRVKTEKLESIATSALSNTLAGRASGVTIAQNSGFAGSSSTIRIRGSLYEPLYVIDDIVTNKTEFDALNPNEVEEISILKDAAAASIYGMKAADGVIIVKTKGGRINQKTKFSYQFNYSFQKLTENSNNFTGYDEVIYRNDVMETQGKKPYYTQEEVDYVKKNNINYNIFDIIWRDPSQLQHSFSASGGSIKTKYYFMGSYHKSLGSIENTKYEKFNFRSNVTSQLTDDLKLNINISGNQRVTNRFFFPYDWDNGEGFTIQDFYRGTFNMSRLIPWYVDKNGNPLTSRTKDAIPTIPGGWHPGEVAFGDGNRDITYRTINLKAKLDWDLSFILQGFTTSLMANIKGGDGFQKDLRLHQSYKKPIMDPNNKIKFDKNSSVKDWPTGGHNLAQSYENIYERASFNNFYQLNWFLNYKNDFGKHHINILTVLEQREYEGKNMYGTANKLMTRDIPQIFSTSSDSKDRWFDGNEYESAYSSFLGRLNYNFLEKYIVEFSFRYDGNYKFPKGERFGFFPSISGAWRLSEEPFVKSLDLFKNLKLRGSYGTSGNDIDGGSGVAPFLYQNNYQKGSTYVFGSTKYNGIRPGRIPNPYITWAKTEMWNIGLDFSILNGKVSGEIDYFNRFNSDILGHRIRTIPSTWGGSAPKLNYQETKIYGVDFLIKYSDRIGDFKYNVGFNMSYSKDEVVYIDEPEGLESWRSAIGKPQYRLFGYKSKGIIRDQATLDALPKDFKQFGRDPKLGVILFEDIRGANYSEGPDGKIDHNDETYLSDNATPRINYGISLGAQWKGISIDILFQGVGAYDKMISTKNTSSGGVFQTGDKPYFGIWTDHWSKDNPNSKYPRADGWGIIESGYGASSFWMKNGSYFRLRNINIAYDLPIQILNFVNINKFQLFFNGSNLFTYSDFEDIMDPEQKALDSYPLMKTYSLGLNITF